MLQKMHSTKEEGHVHVHRVESKEVFRASKAFHGLACNVQDRHVCSLFGQPLEATDNRVAFEHFHLSANEQRAKEFSKCEVVTLSMIAGYSGTTMYLHTSDAEDSKIMFKYS
jgi:hypothetical protein